MAPLHKNRRQVCSAGNAGAHRTPSKSPESLQIVAVYWQQTGKQVSDNWLLVEAALNWRLILISANDLNAIRERVSQ